MTGPLDGKVALVAGATRGAGRAIALELALAGAKVYATGRSTRLSPSPMARPETIEETADIIAAAGGRAVAMRVDHTQPAEVAALVQRIAKDEDGRFDILVNDIWGGDDLTEWEKPFHEHSLEAGLRIIELGMTTHIITSRLAVPLMVARKAGLIVEITDGITDRYRGSLFYDLAKAGVIRFAKAQAEELRVHGIAAVAVSPGFLRSEAMLERLGVTEANWRDGAKVDPHFAASETPRYLGRAVAALAADPEVMKRSGAALATWNLAKEYGFTDLDGSQPDWRAHALETLGIDFG
ncbi:MAG: SDR family NAD(P)-dependent oxidoreductase [Bauldia sp.]|nr:SDR family NAD(P)-dependent oxidoreductase [Bauldia sp.]